MIHPPHREVARFGSAGNELPDRAARPRGAVRLGSPGPWPVLPPRKSRAAQHTGTSQCVSNRLHEDNGVDSAADHADGEREQVVAEPQVADAEEVDFGDLLEDGGEGTRQGEDREGPFAITVEGEAEIRHEALQEAGAQNHDAVRIPRKDLRHPVHGFGDSCCARLADDIAAERAGNVEAAADCSKGKKAVAAGKGHEQAPEHGIGSAENAVDHADNRHDDDLHQREANEKLSAGAVHEVGNCRQDDADNGNDEIEDADSHRKILAV